MTNPNFNFHVGLIVELRFFFNNLFKMLGFDYMSSSPEMLIFGSKRKRSYFGVVLSFLNYCTCLTLMIWFFQDWIFYSKPQIIQSLNNDQNVVGDISGMPIAFNLLNPYVLPFADQDKLFYPEILRFDATGKTSYSIVPTKCTPDSFGSYYNFFKDIPNIDSYFCILPDKHNFTLHSTYGSPEELNLNIVLNKCINGTYYDWFNNLNSNRSDCSTPEIIEVQLKELFLSYITISNAIKHDLETPFSPELKKIFIPVSISLFKRFFLNYNSVEYTTDSGIMMKSVNKVMFTQFDFMETSLDLAKSSLNKFSQISIEMSGIKITYERSYIKIQQTFANMGGIFSCLTMICSFLVSIYSQTNLYVDLANIYFDFTPNETDSILNYEGQIKVKDQDQSIKPLEFAMHKIYWSQQNKEGKLAIGIREYFCMKPTTKVAFDQIKKKISLDSILENIMVTDLLLMRSPELKKEKLSFYSFYKDRGNVKAFLSNSPAEFKLKDQTLVLEK